MENMINKKISARENFHFSPQNKSRYYGDQNDLNIIKDEYDDQTYFLNPYSSNKINPPHISDQPQNFSNHFIFNSNTLERKRTYENLPSKNLNKHYLGQNPNDLPQISLNNRYTLPKPNENSYNSDLNNYQNNNQSFPSNFQTIPDKIIIGDEEYTIKNVNKITKTIDTEQEIRKKILGTELQNFLKEQIKENQTKRMKEKIKKWQVNEPEINFWDRTSQDKKLNPQKPEFSEFHRKTPQQMIEKQSGSNESDEMGNNNHIIRKTISRNDQYINTAKFPNLQGSISTDNDLSNNERYPQELNNNDKNSSFNFNFEGSFSEKLPNDFQNKNKNQDKNKNLEAGPIFPVNQNKEIQLYNVELNKIESEFKAQVEKIKTHNEEMSKHRNLILKELERSSPIIRKKNNDIVNLTHPDYNIQNIERNITHQRLKNAGQRLIQNDFNSKSIISILKDENDNNLFAQSNSVYSLPIPLEDELFNVPKFLDRGTDNTHITYEEKNEELPWDSKIIEIHGSQTL